MFGKNERSPFLQWNQEMVTSLKEPFFTPQPLRLEGIVIAWVGRRRPEPCEHDNSS